MLTNKNNKRKIKRENKTINLIMKIFLIRSEGGVLTKERKNLQKKTII